MWSISFPLTCQYLITLYMRLLWIKISWQVWQVENRNVCSAEKYISWNQHCLPIQQMDNKLILDKWTKIISTSLRLPICLSLDISSITKFNKKMLNQWVLILFEIPSRIRKVLHKTIMYSVYWCYKKSLRQLFISLLEQWYTALWINISVLIIYIWFNTGYISSVKYQKKTYDNIYGIYISDILTDLVSYNVFSTCKQENTIFTCRSLLVSYYLS